MSHADCWALVPLRDLRRGKERLARVLDEPARGMLIEAMARDVVAGLLAAGIPPERVVLVSEDAEVARLCQYLGVALFQPLAAERDPLNAALSEAAAFVQARGATRTLMLHADLPCITAAALQALCAAHEARAGTPRTTLVTDRTGSGTNCLLLEPPGCIALCFGPDSRARHLAAATDAGADYAEFIQADLAFDVDFPEDLRALVRLDETPDNACGAHTRAWLSAHRTALR